MRRLGSILTLGALFMVSLVACQRGGADSGVTQGGSETGTETETETETETGTGTDTGERRPFVDTWKTVGSGPAAGLERLSIGGRLSNDNFVNRGNIEVNYVEGIDEITIEMQRFTVSSLANAAGSFERMHPWLYDLSTPSDPEGLSPDDACWAPGTTACYVRAYYDGMFQPVRDGANFRVTIPAGWAGALELVTSDNLEEGIDSYPDRSDILVDGLAGPLAVDLDSGNVAIRIDPNLAHYAGCPANDECVMLGYAPGCGCAEPTEVSVSNKASNASNITVDVGNVDHWYTVLLENRAADPACTATIDCSAFAECQLDPDYAATPWAERAEINYPGDPAIAGAGIRIMLVSESCADVPFVNSPDDYENPDMPIEQRGDIEVCAGCL